MTKRGLSDIVTNVLIILLVLVAIGIIWYFVNPFIQNSAGGLQGANDCLTVKLTTVSCQYISAGADVGKYTVSYRRDSGAGNLKEARLIFTNSSGSKVWNVNGTMPNQFESASVTSGAFGAGLQQVDIAAVINVDDPAGRTCEPSGRPVQCA